MLIADVLHSYVPITIVGRKNPHKLVVQNRGFTPQLVLDLRSPSQGRDWLILLNDVLIIIVKQFDDLHFFGFLFFRLFLE